MEGYEGRPASSDEPPEDERFRKQLEVEAGRAHDAAEYHATELERAERIGRSARQALEALGDVRPPAREGVISRVASSVRG